MEGFKNIEVSLKSQCNIFLNSSKIDIVYFRKKCHFLFVHVILGWNMTRMCSQQLSWGSPLKDISWPVFIVRLLFWNTLNVLHCLQLCETLPVKTWSWARSREETSGKRNKTWDDVTWAVHREKENVLVCVCVCVYKHPWVVQVCHMVLFQVVCVELNGTCLVYLVYTSVPTLVCVIKGATSTTVRWKHEESEWPTEPWVSPSERPAVQTAGTRPARWWCRPWSAGEEWRQTPGSTHRCLQHNIFCHFY